MTNQNKESVEVNRLLQEAQNGNSGAFEQLCQLYRDSLKRTVNMRMDLQLRRRIDASDIIQEACVVAAQRFTDYLERKPISFRIWLRQIVQDQLLMAYRQHVVAHQRTTRREMPLPERTSLILSNRLLAHDPTPSEQVVRREQIHQLRLAIDKLAACDKEILLLREFEQLSYKEISYVLGIDMAAARKRYGRALIRLSKIACTVGLGESQL